MAQKRLMQELQSLQKEKWVDITVGTPGSTVIGLAQILSYKIMTDGRSQSPQVEDRSVGGQP